MIRRRVVTVATSRADDAAFLALRDAAAATAHVEARIVGGQMVALLAGAFPSRELIMRRTADADAGFGPTVAASGSVHTSLLGAGYEAIRGNHYEQGDRAIDLLVPSATARFAPVLHGGRAFDAVPGLHLALANEPIHLDVRATLSDRSEVAISARVPTVEAALVLKALAIESRLAPKDVVDAFNLLTIRHGAEPDEIGGWRLRSDGLTGSRADAAAALHRLADRARSSRVVAESEVPRTTLVALIREFVTRPATP